VETTPDGLPLFSRPGVLVNRYQSGHCRDPETRLSAAQVAKVGVGPAHKTGSAEFVPPDNGKGLARFGLAFAEIE